jgi:hypothetical protein
MGKIDTVEVDSIGLNDETWKSMPRDEARSLLCIFTAPDTEAHALGTLLVPTPNGKDLYVTPRMSPLLPF